MATYNNTPANIENNNARTNEQVNNNKAEKIDDFGQKIGGARKDLYTAANEWAAQMADITAEALTKAGGVSKLVRLPNLEKLTEAGAITAEQARAALVIWRGIERKPSGTYRADRWANRTRARLEAAAAIITGTDPEAEDVRDIITAARESAELATLTAANWPAVPFSFGKYSVIRCRYSNVPKLQIQDARLYRGTASEDPADIVRQLREMVSRDEEQAADRRAAGPALGVYKNRAGVYYIAPADRSEIILQTYETRDEAIRAHREDRAALVARYTALKNFPACRRDWNRPRVGEDWRKGENMTPEQFAAVLPFRGVEFGNWVNQTERAALLNSAFDGFHDLAAVLNIAPAAVTLNGSLSFAFASRGHSGAAAHYESARRVINLTKKSGAGCMAHEWWHAVDNFAAGGGIHNFATERADHPKAHAILEAIEKTAFFTRSKNLAKFKGDYWTEGRELTARAFEGVCAVMLNAAGVCSDFLVNCKSMDEFTAEDVASRSDFYPYPTADEAAALLPLYVDFLREVFGDILTAPAACYEEAKRAAARAEEERKEAERIAAERAEQERKESERKAAELRERLEREAEARKQAAAHTVELLREVLTARHFDAIATAYDAAAAYVVAHLEGEIYTLSADIKTANEQGRAYIESRPAAIVQYKRVHNAKRIISRRYQVPEIHAAKWNARELVESLNMCDVRNIVRTFEICEKAETWAKAAKLWEDTQRLHAEQAKRNTLQLGGEIRAKRENCEAPAAGLCLEDTAEGVRVVGNDWKDTYFNKKEIKAHGAKWNKERKQWEATDPEDVARLRAWFALRNEEQAPAPAAESEQAAPTTLQDAGEITAPTTEEEPAAEVLPEWATEGARVTILHRGEQLRGYITEIHKSFRGGRYICTFHELGTLFFTPVDVSECAPVQEAAPTVPDWLKVGARVRTRGRYMMTTRSRRPEWVEGEEMTVISVFPDFVKLENRREDGLLLCLQSIATSQAADELTPVYSECEKLENPAEPEPLEVAASRDTDEERTESEAPAATYETSATAEEQQQAAALPFMEKAAILDKVTARIYAPWGDVSKMWLCPFRGACDVWSEWARGYNFRDGGRLADWALTAKVGERAEYRGFMVQIWERDGQTAAEPESEADRLKANRETRERLRAAIVSELEAAAVFVYDFPGNEMKVFGKCANAAELYKVEDIARRYPSAQFRHEDRAAVFEFNFPLFFPHFFPTDPAPEPSGEGVACSYDTNGPVIETGEIKDNIMTFQIGDRVQRIGTGQAGTVDLFLIDEGKRTYIVKYDEMQRRPDGFEYQNEEVFAEEIELAPFFIAGKKYRCIQDVKMKKGGEVAFKAGNIYEQATDPTKWCGWLRNEQNARHGWPQPIYIPSQVKTWRTKPEDIDPRNFFVIVIH